MGIRETKESILIQKPFDRLRVTVVTFTVAIVTLSLPKGLKVNSL